MAIGTAHEPPRTRFERDASPDRVIDRQLRRTTLQVRLVDLTASLAVWLVALLASLFVLAIVDHWLVSIGAVGRWLALLAIVAGSAWYFVTQLGPLVLRRINSAYAAKVIEEAEPSLKNSILNFLLLRGSPAAVPEVIVDALRDRAALDITRAPVDHAVDRTPLIRLGYLLCGVMVLFAAYKLFSPKDPFRTVARVFAPWADIARPSRVQITAVQPGHAEAYQGQTIAITAEVEGVRSRDSVELVYSTADGQTIDAVVPMQSDSAMHFSASLPAEADAGGLQQNVVYRVRAGDAESPSYELRVLPSPRIAVERVELHFPSYTKREPQVLNQGDIRAVEGTRAIVYAKANQEIASAYLEFDASNEGQPRRAPTLAMKAEGMVATGEFRLERLRDGSARYTSYRVRLLSAAGLQDDRPTLHRIEALADLAPEIEVLAPMERRVELPLDRTLKVELRGRDPDFGLRKVTLELVKGDVPLETIVLLEQEQGRLGPANVSFTVSPEKLGLVSGDELRFAGVAEDNRHDAQGALSPNVSRTDRYVVVITASEASERKQSNQRPPSDATSEKSDDRRPMGNTDDKRSDQPEKSDSPTRGDERGEPMNDTGERNDGSKDPKGSETSTGEKPEPGSKSTGEKRPQQSGSKGGEGEQQEGDQSEEGVNASGSEGESGSTSKSSKPSGNSGALGSKSSGEQSSGEESEGEASEGASGSSSSSKTGNKSQKAGSRSGEGTNDSGEPSVEGSETGEGSKPGMNSAEGTSKSGEPREGEGAGQRPKHDGEVFDETLKRIREQQEKSGEAGSKPSAGDERGESTQGSSSSTTGEKTGRPMTGDQPGAEASTGNQKGGDQEQSGAGQQGSKPGEKTVERPQPPSASGAKSDDQGNATAGEETGSPMDPGGGKEPKEGDSSATGGAGKQGDPGSGREPNKPNPTGDPQTPSRETPKSPKSEGGKPKSDQASASASSRKQSDSEGETSGDQAGGGGQGAGQSGKKPGNDAPGSSQSAESGSGTSSEEGKGETGDKAGNDEKANGATGKSGTEQGPGSKPKPGENGSKPSAGESGTSEGGGAQQGEQAAKSLKRDPSKQGATDGTVSGGGVASDGEPQTIAKKPQEIADTEAENLEYAKRSTDLALKYLKDQKNDPDPELLKRLGWTKEELDAFVRRWESLKNSAREDTETREELDDAYRSLGLRPAGDKRRSAGAGDDASRSLRDAGARSEPPSSYADQFRAFRKGAGQK